MVDAGEFSGELNHAGQCAGCLDDGCTRVAAKGIRAGEFYGEIQALVEDAGKWVRRVKADRGEQRHDFTQEVVMDPCALFGCPQAAADELDAFLCQSRQDIVIEQGVLLGNDGVGFEPHPPEYLGGQQAITAGRRAAELDLLLEPGHADFEELIEIAGDYAQEAQTFQQGNPCIGRLREHAAVEGQQGKFAVEEVFGGGAMRAGHGNRGRRLCAGGGHGGGVVDAETIAAGLFDRIQRQVGTLDDLFAFEVGFVDEGDADAGTDARFGA